MMARFLVQVAVVVAAAMQRMTPEELAATNVDGLLEAAGKLLSDNTPEARESARQMIPLLRGAYEVTSTSIAPAAAAPAETAAASEPDKENAEGTAAAAPAVPAAAAAAGGVAAGEKAPPSEWEKACLQRLGSSTGHAVLKVCN